MLKSYYKKGLIEAGCDEAGRGCLAGPVFAAAVILPSNIEINDLNDSKKMSGKKRRDVREIIQTKAIAWAVAKCEVAEIDKINILNASILAMHKALDKLITKPNFIIVDGNKFKPYKDISHECIVKGDGKYLAIAAASVLAKTYRDDYMMELDKQFPLYNWKQNKAYATKEHRIAILKYGYTAHHRKTFFIKDMQFKLDL